jgi:hypothetical protein
MADLKQLMAMMGISSANPSMGGGMVGQAAQKLGGRGYQLYLQEAQALGQPAITPEEFAKMQQRPKGLLAL